MISTAANTLQVLEESGPEMKTLKANKVKLTDEERAKVMASKAVWHPSNHEKPTAGVWKSVIRGQTWYVCATHRAYQAKKTLKGAIAAFPAIAETA